MDKLVPLLPSDAPLEQPIFCEELALLIGKTCNTIRTCSTNEKYAHLIPRPSKLPRSRRLVWRRADVLNWIQNAALVQPAKKVGAPTLAERARKQKMEQLNAAHG